MTIKVSDITLTVLFAFITVTATGYASTQMTGGGNGILGTVFFLISSVTLIITIIKTINLTDQMVVKP
jgi:uncharacterized membrane protein